MNNERRLVREMAEQCLSLVTQMDPADQDSDMPNPLHKEHIGWMCVQVEKNVDDWPLAKLHRWIGFIQCALLANRALDLDGLKSMFDKAKIAHGHPGEELFDHLNPDSSFEFDIGGQG